jgi:hypothetical protein
MYNSSFHPWRLAGACSLAAALFCGSVTEAKAQPGSELLTDIIVTGVTDSTLGIDGSFSGALTLTEIHFDASTTNTLILIGNLTGTATSATDTTHVLEQIFTTTGTLTAIGGTKNKCGLLTLDVGTIDLALVDTKVEVEDILIDVAATKGKARKLGNQLCKLSRFIAKADVNQVNKIVNKIISITKTPLTNVAVSGSANGDGSFTGFLNIDRLEVDPSGNLIVYGLLNGVANVDSSAKVINGATFSTSTTIYGTTFGSSGCDTIFMNLGTIVLTDQDVTLELADMVVHTGATQGATKKAAKSLCSIAKTLAKQEVKPVDTLKLVKKLTKNVVKLNQQLLP